MSTNIFWRPENSGNILMGNLKSILKNSGYFKNSDQEVLSYFELSMLKAIKSASTDEKTVSDCETLIKAINQHERIVVYLS